MEDQTENKFKPIGIFLSITFALSTIFYFLIIHSGKLGGESGKYAMGIMWCPGISALITMKILKRNISDLGWKWGKTKYQIRSYLIPLLYAFIAYIIIWSFGWGEFYNKETVNGITESFGLGEIGDGFSILFYFIYPVLCGFSALKTSTI